MFVSSCYRCEDFCFPLHHVVVDWISFGFCECWSEDEDTRRRQRRLEGTRTEIFHCWSEWLIVFRKLSLSVCSFSFVILSLETQTLCSLQFLVGLFLLVIVLNINLCSRILFLRFWSHSCQRLVKLVMLLAVFSCTLTGVKVEWTTVMSRSEASLSFNRLQLRQMVKLNDTIPFFQLITLR